MRKIKTDEEIRFAMERCGTTENKSCEKCPYYTNTATCVERMLGDALELINRQQEEIEELRKALLVKSTEIEAEAIKEFAERLKYTLVINNEGNTDIFDYVFTLETLDNLVKEMVGK